MGNAADDQFGPCPGAGECGGLGKRGNAEQLHDPL